MSKIVILLAIVALACVNAQFAMSGAGTGAGLFGFPKMWATRFGPPLYTVDQIRNMQMPEGGNSVSVKQVTDKDGTRTVVEKKVDGEKKALYFNN